MYALDELLRLIADRIPHPATPREILQTLRVPREERAEVKRHLQALVTRGDLVQIRGHRVGLSDRMDLVVGRVHVNPAGYGFVSPERTGDVKAADIYIPAHQLSEAMHGDRVVARVERQTEKGSEGRIVRVLERQHPTLVGRLEVDAAGLEFVVPFDRRITADVQVIPGQSLPADPGVMVVIEISRWPTPMRGPAGRIVEVLGRIDDPGVDTQVVIRKFHIPDVYRPEAIAEARAIGSAVRPRDLKNRTDFRQVTTVTIDGEHARDFDDAITIERLSNGNFWLGVHIADVSHYVGPDTALDQEAYERGTSVYFPERAVHMFPPDLATGLCSLNPRVDRLVQSCLMEVSPHGVVVRYEVHAGVINSDARMTYTAVNAILTDADPAVAAEYAALVPMFRDMEALFQILHQRRRHRGSIDFDLPEAQVIVDERGGITDIVAAERNVAHRIIEEFMLLANETVAAHLVAHGVPTLHRVHEAPDARKIDEFEAFIAPLGYSLAAGGQAVTPRHFQRLVERMRDTPEERPIATLMLRTMQKARYDAASLGHFGLAAEFYTHFTSPIRRYPDLVVHRMLRESMAGRISKSRSEELEEELPEVARHTSERERRADDAERELLQWKKVRFMADKVGDQFGGFITGVAPFGLFVELDEHYVEGLVHISGMADDYYRFLDQQHALFGEHTKKLYRLGDEVEVQVIRVDQERRQVDFGLVEVLEAVRHAGQKGGRRSASPGRASAPKREQRVTRRPGRRERVARRSRR